MNTGVEAGETAIKLARRWAYEVKGVAAEQASEPKSPLRVVCLLRRRMQSECECSRSRKSSVVVAVVSPCLNAVHTMACMTWHGALHISEASRGMRDPASHRARR